MSRAYRVSFIEGDGIGPEIFASARSVLETISECHPNLNFDFIPTPAGDATLAKSGEALPRDSFIKISESDLCLKAPVGETARETIIKIRQDLDLFANIRPARNYDFIESKFSNVDLVIVRENTEDLYVGREFEEEDGRRATALKVTTEKASKRIAKMAFDTALSRAKTAPQKSPAVVCVQKSNVLPVTDGLFMKSCGSIAEGYPSVKYSTMYVDTAAMNLVRNPESFDVIVTSNVYGDILSDEASQIVGGLGVAGSANIGNEFALFEPVHGCAPDIAGKGIANPLSMIFAAKMMLEWLGMKRNDLNCISAAKLVDQAVSAVGGDRILTPDIGGNSSTLVVTKAICKNIKESKDGGEENYDYRGKNRMSAKNEATVTTTNKQDVLLKW